MIIKDTNVDVLFADESARLVQEIARRQREYEGIPGLQHRLECIREARHVLSRPHILPGPGEEL